MRLIDADALLSDLSWYGSTPECYSEPTLDQIRNNIKRAPTIEERKEAYWKYDPDTGAWECTACNALWIFTADGPKENDANFCPVCGAQILDQIDEKGRPWKQ